MTIFDNFWKFSLACFLKLRMSMFKMLLGTSILGMTILTILEICHSLFLKLWMSMFKLWLGTSIWDFENDNFWQFWKFVTHWFLKLLLSMLILWLGTLILLILRMTSYDNFGNLSLTDFWNCECRWWNCGLVHWFCWYWEWQFLTILEIRHALIFQIGNVNL